MTTQALDPLVLRSRLNSVALQVAKLTSVRETDQLAHDKFVQEVAKARARQGLHDEVVTVMGALQNRAHERSVGAFEKLLTAITADILPGEGDVKLITQFKANTTWMDVRILKKNGFLEDAFEGNGGAISNVLSLGLRYIALTRTNNRRVMVLDEPDCWTEPARAPNMVRVIAEVSQQINTQTLFIMHHKADMFEGVTNIVELLPSDDGYVKGVPRAPLVQQWESDEQPGIRSIELINLRSHKHTVLPCYPGATAYIGSNNLGKSTAITTALRMVAYGITDDTMITHGEDEVKVIVTLEKGIRIEVSRHSKRNPAVQFSLYEAGNPEPVRTERAPSKNQVPDWVASILGVTPVDDMDIQLRSQKKPVFLLDESATRRAQILSVGRDSSHLKTVMKRYEELRAQDNATIAKGELQITRLRYRLTALKGLDSCVTQVSELAFESEDIFNFLEKREAMIRFASKYKELRAKLKHVSSQLAAIEQLPAVPSLVDTSPAFDMYQRLSRLTKLVALPQPGSMPTPPTLAVLSEHYQLANKIAAIKKALAALQQLPSMPVAPVLVDTSKLHASGNALANLKKACAALSKLPAALPVIPVLKNTNELSQAATLLRNKEAQLKICDKQAAELEQEYNAAQESLKAIQHECGGQCPLCGSALLLAQDPIK